MKTFLLLIIGTSIGMFAGVTLNEEDHSSQDKLISDQIVKQMRADAQQRQLEFMIQQNEQRMQQYKPQFIQ